MNQYGIINVSRTKQTAGDDKFANDSLNKILNFDAYVRKPTQCSSVNCQFYTNHRLQNLSLRYCWRHKFRKDSQKYRAKIRCFEKRFSKPEKCARKEPRKVFGPEKLLGLLRNARLDSGSRGLRLTNSEGTALCSWARHFKFTLLISKSNYHVYFGFALSWAVKSLINFCHFLNDNDDDDDDDEK